MYEMIACVMCMSYSSSGLSVFWYKPNSIHFTGMQVNPDLNSTGNNNYDNTAYSGTSLFWTPMGLQKCPV